MKSKQSRIIAAACLTTFAVCVSNPALADNLNNRSGIDRTDSRGMMTDVNSDTKTEIQQTIRDATSVYQKFTTKGRIEIPRAQLDKAKCVAIFPGITSVALGVGGRHGDGIVTCKTATGYSRVSPLDLTSVTIGAQLGAKKSDILLLINSEKAKQKLQAGLLTLGADASVVAWSDDQKAVGAMANTDSTDVIAFAEDRGLFAGASLSGTQIKTDQDEVRSLYGANEGVSKILSGALPENETGPVKDLIAMLNK